MTVQTLFEVFALGADTSTHVPDHDRRCVMGSLLSAMIEHPVPNSQEVFGFGPGTGMVDSGRTAYLCPGCTAWQVEFSDLGFDVHGNSFAAEQVAWEHVETCAGLRMFAGFAGAVNHTIADHVYSVTRGTLTRNP